MRRSGKEEKGSDLLCVFCPREEKKEGTEEGGRKHCLICVGSKEEVTCLSCLCSVACDDLIGL